MKFWRRYPTDYAIDTQHLTLSQHGAYGLLLDRAYLTEKPLELNKKNLFARMGIRRESDKKTCIFVLNEFFKKTRKGYTHKRVQEELKYISARVLAARSNGARGGRPPKKKNPLGFSEKPTGLASGFPKQNPDSVNLSRLQTPDYQTKDKTPLPPASGGLVENGLTHDDLLKDSKNYGLIAWGGQNIIVRTGRHRRILTRNTIESMTGSTTERMVDHIRASGFWCEIYKPTVTH